MTEIHKTSRLDQIEEEARKVMPLPRMLRFFGLALSPVWISAAVLATAELSYSPLPDPYYEAVNIAIGSYGVVLALLPFVIILWSKIFPSKGRADERQAESAKNDGKLSSYQLGRGAINVALGQRGVFWLIAAIFIVIFLLERIAGGDRSELTEAALFWYAQKSVAYIIGPIVIFFPVLSLWLGLRVQKQRAAR